MQKRLLIPSVLFLSLLFFASCYSDRNCVCYGDGDEPTVTIYELATKKKATEMCNEQSNSDRNISCELE